MSSFALVSLTVTLISLIGLQCRCSVSESATQKVSLMSAVKLIFDAAVRQRMSINCFAKTSAQLALYLNALTGNPK